MVFIPILSVIGWSKPYDWVSMAAIKRGDDSDLSAAAHVDLELVPGQVQHSDEDQKERENLLRASKIARWLCLFLTISLLVLWPMPMYGSSYVFSCGFFGGCISIGILWLFCSAAIVVIYPLWEGRATSARVFRMMFKELSGKGRAAPGATLHGVPQRVEREGSDDVTVEKVVGKQ